MPGPTARSRWRAAGASPPRNGRSTTSHRAWVPVSMRATTRSWGKAPAPAAGRRAPEGAGVRGGVGHVQGRPVDRHQAQPAQEGARRGRGGEGPGHGVEQLPEQPRRPPAGGPARWPPCSAGATAPGRRPPPAAPAPPRAASRASRPAVDDGGQGVAHRLLRPQPHGHHQGHHQVRRQHPAAPLPRAGALDRRLDGGVRQRRLERLQQGPVAQPRPAPPPRPTTTRASPCRPPDGLRRRRQGYLRLRLSHRYWG